MYGYSDSKIFLHFFISSSVIRFYREPGEGKLMIRLVLLVPLGEHSGESVGTSVVRIKVLADFHA